jgi:hypothetical protein
LSVEFAYFCKEVAVQSFCTFLIRRFSLPPGRILYILLLKALKLAFKALNKSQLINKLSVLRL